VTFDLSSADRRPDPFGQSVLVYASWLAVLVVGRWASHRALGLPYVREER